MKPSEALNTRRDTIRQIVSKYPLDHPRIFGSVSRGEDTENSDLDLLVDPIPGRTTLFTLVELKREIEELTGIRVDVATPMALRDRFRDRVLAEAKPL